jgi:RNA polymerase sigma factor (sigma-70 family)
MRADVIPARAQLRPVRSKRLLALVGDETLVEQIRRGNEAAFEVAFERHGAGILGFCRHMLGSREEAEDAVQHTFAAAFRNLQRNGERPLALKPWLYAVARNRCVSVLRSRRERATEQGEPLTAGPAEQVERRGELLDLLRDLRDLPESQRAALLLSEAGGLSHSEIANVLGCEGAKVKALVFRARSGLIQRRAARETPCNDIREQLANLRGGSLRRRELGYHLRACPDCRAYRENVKQQRRMLAAALPVVPSLGLKSSVLAAVGLGGGSAGGGLAGGFGAAASSSYGSATLAKVALVSVLAGGGAVAGETAFDEPRRSPDPRPQSAAAAAEPPATRADPIAHGGRSPAPEAPAQRISSLELAPKTERTTGGGVQGRTRRADNEHGPRASTPGRTKPRAVPPGHPPRQAAEPGENEKPIAHGEPKPTAKMDGEPKPTAKMDREPGANGRGPIEAPLAQTPVKRGPPEPKPSADRTAKKVKVEPAPPAAPEADRGAPPEASPERAPKAPKNSEQPSGS